MSTDCSCADGSTPFSCGACAGVPASQEPPLASPCVATPFARPLLPLARPPLAGLRAAAAAAAASAPAGALLEGVLSGDVGLPAGPPLSGDLRGLHPMEGAFHQARPSPGLARGLGLPSISVSPRAAAAAAPGAAGLESSCGQSEIVGRSASKCERQ